MKGIGHGGNQLGREPSRQPAWSVPGDHPSGTRQLRQFAQLTEAAPGSGTCVFRRMNTSVYRANAMSGTGIRDRG